MNAYLSSEPRRRGVDRPQRRGAVAVEFAVMAPVLLAIVGGMIELNRVFDAQNLLESAAREGARLACMDREGMLADGQSANDKLVSDVKNFLASNGIPAENVGVTVTHADDPGVEFDLDNPENNLDLFEVSVTIDYSTVSYAPVSAESDYPLAASVVFRNGIVTISD